MKNKKIYHTVGTIPKANIKIVERSKIDTPHTQPLTLPALKMHQNKEQRG